jgi:hypothetical protein
LKSADGVVRNRSLAQRAFSVSGGVCGLRRNRSKILRDENVGLYQHGLICEAQPLSGGPSPCHAGREPE